MYTNPNLKELLKSPSYQVETKSKTYFVIPNIRARNFDVLDVSGKKVGQGRTVERCKLVIASLGCGAEIVSCVEIHDIEPRGRV